MGEEVIYQNPIISMITVNVSLEAEIISKVLKNKTWIFQYVESKQCNFEQPVIKRNSALADVAQWIEHHL